MWQFMQASGREYGLEVNQNIDERYNIEKATRAACKYLKASYAKYGNWLCVAAAYNAGQGRITQQLQRQMVDQAADLWLVEETSRYMFRLLAAKAVFTDPQRYGFMLKREQLYPPVACTTVTVTKGIENLAQGLQPLAARHLADEQERTNLCAEDSYPRGHALQPQEDCAPQPPLGHRLTLLTPASPSGTSSNAQACPDGACAGSNAP